MTISRGDARGVQALGRVAVMSTLCHRKKPVGSFPHPVYPYRWSPRFDGRAQVRVIAWPKHAAVYVDGFYAGIVDAAFVLQAILFAWLAATSRGHFVVAEGMRGILGKALVVYGLAYPVVGLVFGLRFPRLPLFAVPCPTALVTAGLLLIAAGAPRLTNVVPILWSIIGSSAALALGINADIPLTVAAALLALDTVAPSALGVRATPTSMRFRPRSHALRPRPHGNGS